MSSAPLVTVLLPVYNGGEHLPASIESILVQSLDDLELLVVDDGSDDDSVAQVKTYASKDARIRLVRHERNRGLIAALNTGVAESRGRFIARQDADDVSLADRLQAQVDFLRDSPAVGAVGTGYYRVSEDGTRTDRVQPPPDHTTLRWRFLFGNQWVHSSVMVRSELLKAWDPPYRGYLHAEDYELWLRIAKVVRVRTLLGPLVQYRNVESGVSAANEEAQRDMVREISDRQIEELLGPVGRSTCDALRGTSRLRALDGLDASTTYLMLELMDRFADLPGVRRRTVEGIRSRWVRGVAYRLASLRNGERVRRVKRTLRSAAPAAYSSGLARALVNGVLQRLASRRAP